MEGHQFIAGGHTRTNEPLGHLLRGLLQRDGVFVHGQTLEARSIEAGEDLKAIQGPLLFKHRDVALQGHRSVVDARAAAAGFLA